MYSNTLYHHGILGMKWGVRRYQNADGTLTEAGKKRYGNTGETTSKGTSSSNTAKETASKVTTTPKNAKNMSDEELKAAISRIQLEQQYDKLISTPEGKASVSKGRKVASEILESSTKTVGTQLATYALGSAVNKLMGSNVVNVKKDDNNKDSNKNSSSLLSGLSSTSNLSDKQLKDLVSRLQMEKLYKDFTSKT